MNSINPYHEISTIEEEVPMNSINPYKEISTIEEVPRNSINPYQEISTIEEKPRNSINPYKEISTIEEVPRNSINPYQEISTIEEKPRNSINPYKEISTIEEVQINSSTKRKLQNSDNIENKIKLIESSDNMESKSENAKAGIEIQAVLSTIANHMKNDKKRSKALQLMTQFVDSSMTIENEDQFMNWIDNQILLLDEKILYNCTEWAALIHSVYQKMASSKKVLETACKINLLRLKYCVQMRIQVTDDSFEFAQVIRSVINIIEAVKEYQGNNQSIVECLLDCMNSAIRQYSKLWARQPIESLFDKAAFHRLCLDVNQREKLDELTNRMAQLRRKAASGVSNAGFLLSSENGSKDLHPLKNKTTHSLSLLK